MNKVFRTKLEDINDMSLIRFMDRESKKKNQDGAGKRIIDITS